MYINNYHNIKIHIYILNKRKRKSFKKIYFIKVFCAFRRLLTNLLLKGNVNLLIIYKYIYIYIYITVQEREGEVTLSNN